MQNILINNIKTVFTLAITIIGTLTACMVHRTSVGVTPLTRADTMPAYVARKSPAVPVDPP